MINATSRELGRRLISDDDFNHQLQSFITWCRKEMTGQDAFTPTVFTLFPSGKGFKMEVLRIEQEMDTGSKYQVMFNLGMQTMMRTRSEQMASVFLVMEAWASRYADGQKPDRPPAADPNRQEIMLVSGMTMDGRANMATVGIVRRRGGMHFSGEIRVMPFSADHADILGRQSPNKMLLSFFQGYSLAWLAQQTRKS